MQLSIDIGVGRGEHTNSQSLTVNDINAIACARAQSDPRGHRRLQDRALVASDQLHPTETGMNLVAKLIHDLGYGFAN